MQSTTDHSTELLHRSGRSDSRPGLAGDLRTGFRKRPKELPPIYFYDERGSELFERITQLPEYYQTRTERRLLESIVRELAAGEYAELIEFGSGSSAKTRVLLDGMTATSSAATLERYVPIDVSSDFLLATAERLSRDYPSLEIAPVVGDFREGLQGVPRVGSALIIFLGGTIGNFHYDESVQFLSTVAEGMSGEDAFLMGVDLVKDPALLHAAYNDAEGITAEFNRNVLRVINRELNGEFDPEAFYHYAFYNPDDTRIEMRLVSRRDQTVKIGDLEMSVRFREGESILTEISRKFTRASAERLLEDAGMSLVEWWSDPEDLFGLVLAKRRGRGG